ncbi:MAG: methyl-accepting chemotaxis protein [Synergistaceae bacterium]|jgi:methyl-accepting chemotaxis protein|nr:methyl-accepting chemotaxis protein [Synergistaceae bacterium]
MWKNLKISFKLFLGFGLLLLVFVTAGVVTWRNISSVREGSRELAQSIVVVMQETTTLERNLYEYLLAIRRMQADPTDATYTGVKEREVIVQKNIDTIMAMGIANPKLQSPKFLQEKLLEPYKNFVKIIDRMISDFQKKNECHLAARDRGRSMYSSAVEMEASHIQATEEALATLNPNNISERLDRLRRSTEILVEIQTMRLEVQTAVTANDSRLMNNAIRTIPILEKDLIALLDVAVDTGRKRILEQTIKDLQNYTSNLNNFVQAQVDLEEQQRASVVLERILDEESSNASNIARNRVANISMESVVHLNNTITVLFISGLVSIILGISISILISHTISKPLNIIVALAKRAGEGDLTIAREEFQYVGKDELAHLADAISNMIVKQEESMQQVVNVADDLSASANNLSAISEETNASMEEVKASIDHVSTLSENNGAALEQCNAGVEEMSSGADTVAQSATDSASFISQTTNASNKAIQTVNSVIAGMHKVNTNSKEGEDKTRQLVASVENVSSFVSVITGIADQTNLLALNAAIEAARAGEVGRGFAVVAEEVRKLAEESARAAQNVNGIIVELQNSAQESIKATTEAGRMLAETLSQAEQAQTDLNGALQEMNKANDSIQNIAAVAEEQAASSKEVATAIDSATKATMEMVENVSNIRRATDETAQAAQGMAEQSEAMNEHAQTLIEVLSCFMLHNINNAQNNSAPKALRKPGR